MWQEIITGIIIAAAIFYLVKRYFFKGNAKSGCGSCPAALPEERKKTT